MKRRIKIEETSIEEKKVLFADFFKQSSYRGLTDVWYDDIHRRWEEQVLDYALFGKVPDSEAIFCVLTDDLFGLFDAISEYDMNHARFSVRWMLTYLPAESFGDEEVVREWSKSGGMVGRGWKRKSEIATNRGENIEHY